jgi:hypothetical protein
MLEEENNILSMCYREIVAIALDKHQPNGVVKSPRAKGTDIKAW